MGNLRISINKWLTSGISLLRVLATDEQARAETIPRALRLESGCKVGE
jgi:hypothetical protein